MVTQPNLFHFATSELSQDAILAWLLQWADQQYAPLDEPLHKTARHFIEALYAKANRPVPEFDNLKVRTQYNKIDILAHFETPDGQKHAILIEDKVGTHEHSDQLNRYRKYLIKEDGYEPENILAVFLKTGYQHEWSAVDNAKYHVFTAEDLLRVWEFGTETAKVDNHIFLEYAAYLNQITLDFKKADNDFKTFRNFKVGEWTEWHWKGFFTALKDNLTHFGYNHNQFRRDQMLSCWFGQVLLPFTEGETSFHCGPNLDLAIVNGVPSLSIRMWVQHLTQTGLDYQTPRAVIMQKLETLHLNGRPGKFKKANDSILLRKLPADFGDLYADQLTLHLQSLQTQLQSIDTQHTTTA